MDSARQSTEQLKRMSSGRRPAEGVTQLVKRRDGRCVDANRHRQDLDGAAVGISTEKSALSDGIDQASCVGAGDAL